MFAKSVMFVACIRKRVKETSKVRLFKKKQFFLAIYDMKSKRYEML